VNALVKYNAARTALAEAHAVDEVKDIRDKAEAMAAYARQAHDTEMIAWVTEIKVRAERRAGELLAEMGMNRGAAGTGSNQHQVRSHDVTAPKLSDLGITKNESSRWQKLAAVPADKFEQAVSAAKEIAGEVTTAAMLRAAQAEQPAKPVAQPAPVVYDPNPDPYADLLADYEREVADNAALRERLDTLLADDTAAELDKWVQKFHQLEGRLGQALTTSNEAQRQATRQGKLLKAIREHLGVERDSEILPKLKGGAK
jgi:hypothetical protein